MAQAVSLCISFALPFWNCNTNVHICMQKIVSMCIHPCLLKIHISVHTLSLSRSSFYNHSRRSQTREPTEDTFLALPVPLFYYHFCFYFVSLVTTAHYNPSQIPKYKDQGSSPFQLKSCSSCHQEWPNTPWFTVRSLPYSQPVYLVYCQVPTL